MSAQPPSSSAAQPVRIDFIADVVCPWCYLGWERLRQAVALRPALQVAVTWRPYQLEPDLPEEGVDKAEHTARRFPDPERRRAAAEALTTLAAEDGLPLDLAAARRTPNTSAAHRLIKWAAGQGAQDAAVDALFRAYFVEGRDIGDPLVLAELGAGVGLDRMQLLDLYAQGVDVAQVRHEHETAREAGVTGVPFMVFSGRFGVSGAQDPARLAKALDTAAREGG